MRLLWKWASGLLAGVALVILCAAWGAADEETTPSPDAVTPQQAAFFATQAYPVLYNRCFGCHSDKRQSGGLRLDSLANMLRGGARGAALVPGNPNKSRLIQAIRYDGALKMPPTGKLRPEEIAALTEWVKRGAPWPGASLADATRQAANSLVTPAPKTPRPVSLLAPPFAPHPPDVGLSVVANAAIKLTAANQAVCDLGRISQLDTTRIERSFTLRNDSKVPLAQLFLRPSCGCTTALFGATGATNGTTAPPENGVLPALAPGQQVIAQVALNVGALAPGAFTKTVDVYIQNSAQPAATLLLQGVLAPAVAFTPSILNFGPTRAGAESRLTVTATLDARLIPANGALPALVCSNAAVHIRPVTTASGTVGKENAGSQAAAPPTRAQTYEISLAPNAPLGALTGRLMYTAPPNATESVSMALSRASVYLSGQVIGDLSAQPQVVAFGVVTAGQSAMRQILLTGTPTTDMRKLTVTGDSPLLSTHLSAFAGSPGAVGTCALEISLSAQAPPGLFQSAVKVALANGQTLLIPVNAYVRKGAE